MKAEGALGAALFAAAALLLAPGDTRAAAECGGSQSATLTCSMTSYSDGIYYGGSAYEVYGTGGTTVNIPGSGASTTTITSGASQSVGVHVDTIAGQNRPFTLNIGGATGGTAHVVNIVQGTNANNAANRNNGVYVRDQGQYTGTTINLERGVTIGSATAPMKQNGLWVVLDGAGLIGTGEAAITSAATIFAAKRGIRVGRSLSTTTSATTITNRGAISSGEEGIYLEYPAPGNASNNGSATIVNTGAITVSGAYAGINMDYRGSGDAEIDNAGAVTAAGAGIVLSRADGAGAATVTNRGAVQGQGGQGISASYATAAVGNGAIRVTVAEGASVTGGAVGVHVANAGTGLMVARKYTPGFAMGEDPDELVAAMHGEGADAVALLNQLVTVRGAVTGGTEAAIRLSGGGGVLVLEGGAVRAGSSGVGIAADGPALVYIDGEVRGAAGGAAAVHLSGGGSVTVGLNGRVRANGADYAIHADGAPVTVTLIIDSPVVYLEDVARVEGGYRNVESVRFREDRDGVSTGYSTTLQVGDDGLLDASGLPSRLCEEVEAEGDRRCRMYEALPSMLLALNALPSWAERSAAARDANGGWASVEASRGEWRAKKAAATAGKLAYDYRWFVARAGVDFAPRKDLRVGWSVHVPRGKAEMAGVGEVELDGVGAGVSATWRSGDLYVDAQAAVTRYDVGLTSYTHGELLDNDASGVGYALGVEGGKRMPVGGAFVTPRAGLAWSEADLDDFTDMETAGDTELRSRVSVQDARSVKGRVGVMVEKEVEMGAASGRVFGSLDVEREFSDETEVQVGEQRLKTEVRPTAVSLGAGAVFDVRENVLLRAVAGYRTSGGGTSGYRGGLELQVRF